MAQKVTIFPCTGICKVAGTIARQVAYKVVEDLRLDDTLLECLPALVRGVKEDIDMLDYPVIVIEGCEERCANYALEIRGGKAAGVVFIPLILTTAEIIIQQPEGKTRRQLTPEEEKIVDLAAEEAAKLVDKFKPESCVNPKMP